MCEGPCRKKNIADHRVNTCVLQLKKNKTCVASLEFEWNLPPYVPIHTCSTDYNSFGLLHLCTWWMSNILSLSSSVLLCINAWDTVSPSLANKWPSESGRQYIDGQTSVGKSSAANNGCSSVCRLGELVSGWNMLIKPGPHTSITYRLWIVNLSPRLKFITAGFSFLEVWNEMLINTSTSTYSLDSQAYFVKQAHIPLLNGNSSLVTFFFYVV